MLSEFGFRLPSCLDNRPLRFEEWETVPAADDLRQCDAGALGDGADGGGAFAEQVIRPTGLIDPVTEVRPVERQVDDLLAECAGGDRARAGGSW